MIAPRLPRVGTWPAWRAAARRLRAAGVAPQEVDWALEGDAPGLFAEPLPAEPPDAPPMTVPRGFAALAEALVAHRDLRGMALAYRIFWRLGTRPKLLADPVDRDMAAALALERSVRRDRHKMRAFVRFRELERSGVPGEGRGRRMFEAWFEPAHRIEEMNGAFFARRFADMDWLIRTPEITLAHVGGTLSARAEANRRELAPDALEELWKTYYAGIFNPARLKVKAMTAEMPKRYWRNLPEAELIAELVRGAAPRTHAMLAQAPVPAPAAEDRRIDTLEEARAAAGTCTRCPLHCEASRTVFGAGPPGARLLIVGEQPGDAEDRAGRPFVGPAGQLLRREAQAAGLDLETAYLTNAVKHFKFTRKGTRRLHQRPSASEVDRCRWWLDIEGRLLAPDLTVALGATAAGALTGDATRLAERRGKLELDREGRPVFVTVHPAYLLRLPDAQTRMQETERFREDLAAVARLARAPAEPAASAGRGGRARATLPTRGATDTPAD